MIQNILLWILGATPEWNTQQSHISRSNSALYTEPWSVVLCLSTCSSPAQQDAADSLLYHSSPVVCLTLKMSAVRGIWIVSVPLWLQCARASQVCLSFTHFRFLSVFCPRCTVHSVCQFETWLLLLFFVIIIIIDLGWLYIPVCPAIFLLGPNWCQGLHLEKKILIKCVKESDGYI